LAAARRVASDSSTPGRHARRQWYSTRRAARLVCGVATCRPDRVRLVRHTSHVGGGPTRPTRPTLSDSVGRRCHGTRDSSDMPPLESPPDSSTRQTPRTLSDEDVTAHATRKTCPRSKVHLKSTRLVDSSDSSVRSSDSVGQRCHGTRETRLVRHAPARKSARQRLVDSSDSSHVNKKT
jgi:hypothetical protein